MGTVRWQAPELIPDMQGEDPDVTDRRNTTATDIYAYALVCHEVNHILETSPRYITERYDRCSPISFHSTKSQVTSKLCLP